MKRSREGVAAALARLAHLHLHKEPKATRRATSKARR